MSKLKFGSTCGHLGSFFGVCGRINPTCLGRFIGSDVGTGPPDGLVKTQLHLLTETVEESPFFDLNPEYLLYLKSSILDMASGTIVLITGANTGLGLETVKALCRSSKVYTILLGGRSLEKAATAAQEARDEYPKSPSAIEPIQVDIEDDTSISNAFDTVSSKYGYLDVLINNAGKFLWITLYMTSTD